MRITDVAVNVRPPRSDSTGQLHIHGKSRSDVVTVNGNLSGQEVDGRFEQYPTLHPQEANLQLFVQKVFESKQPKSKTCKEYSSRAFGPLQTFVSSAAKVSKEPRVTDAALCKSVRSHFRSWKPLVLKKPDNIWFLGRSSYEV